MTKAERTRVTWMLAVLAVLVLVLVVQRQRARTGGGGPGEMAEVSFRHRPVPKLDLAALTPVPVGKVKGGRNPFIFGRRPTPTPNLTPRPTLPPRPTRPPRPTPTPWVVHTADGKTLPPPPRFPDTYIGFFGPAEKLVAVFRRGKDVEVAPIGGTIGEKFIVRKIGFDSVTIGYVGYPEEVTTRVPLEK